MTQAFDKIKAALAEKGTLTDEEVAKIASENGELTPEENTWVAAELHERRRSSQAKVTMEQYLEAMKVLDNAAEGSPEYAAAEKIVQQFESAG
jgi:hypothetical protein